jgi:hypothetical protein
MAVSVFHIRAGRFFQDAEKAHQRYWKAEVKAETKGISSSLNLDLSLPLVLRPCWLAF